MALIIPEPPEHYGLRECPDCDGFGSIFTEDGLPANSLYRGDEIEDCPTCDGLGKVRI